MQTTCLHAMRRLTKAGCALDERRPSTEPNKTVPNPVRASSRTTPRGREGRRTATHHHGYPHCTPQAAHGRCRARNDIWLPLNVTIADND